MRIVSNGKPQRIMKFPWEEHKLCKCSCKSASHRVIGKLQDSQEHKQHLRMLKQRLELSVKAITRLHNSQTCFYPEKLLKPFTAASGYSLHASSEKHITYVEISNIESKLCFFLLQHLHEDNLPFLFAFDY